MKIKAMLEKLGVGAGVLGSVVMVGALGSVVTNPNGRITKATLTLMGTAGLLPYPALTESKLAPAPCPQ